MFDAGIVPPPGALGSEGLTFTLVKPPAGACTVIWASTISPRAPERSMEETIPGASVFPTLTRPDATQTGNAAADDLFAFMKITTTTNTPATNSGTFPI